MKAHNRVPMMDPTGQAGKSGAVSGRVTTAGGRPVGDVVVMIAGDSPAHRDIAALTDAQGRYRLTNLAVGEYTVTVNAAGHDLQSGNVRIVEGQEAELNFSLAPPR